MDRSTKRKLIIATFAALAITMATISIWQQSTRASTSAPTSIGIDFTAYPETDTIVLDKGQKLSIPIMIESSADANYKLILSVRPERMITGGSWNGSLNGLTVEVDRSEVTLSPQDVITRLGFDRVERNSGSLLIVSAADNAVEGSNSYLLESKTEPLNGKGMGTGKVFSVTVR